MLPISFEFFPPRTDAQRETFERTLENLSPLKPEYWSVTFGAGGSTRDQTLETVLGLKRRGHDAAPHISCMGGTETSLRELLDTYKEAGIDRVVALRGDRPSGTAGEGDFRYACDLVEFIRSSYGDQFHIEVGCYPECHPDSATPGKDVDYLRQKVEAGADGAITQYFFNADGYFRLVDEARRVGVDVPIVPGIMPISNYTQLARFSDACGAEIPRWIRTRLQAFGEDLDSLRAFGVDVVSDMCQRLIDAGIPGIHFYTLNRTRAVLGIMENLGLAPAVVVEEARLA